MNETDCGNLIKSLKWLDPANLISLSILLFIILLVISGNSLVIAAVFCSNKLRSVTNYFIVNLAVADLLVGLAVLPFSATWEVFKVWIFGDIWCRIWLAVDVWMCTASILNLCAISLDRYVAVTRPVAYPNIMSSKRAKLLIAGIWVLSFVICFPPLVGWKDHKIQPIFALGNYTIVSSLTAPSADHVQGHQQKRQLVNTMPAPNDFKYIDPTYMHVKNEEFIETTAPSKLFYKICPSTCELTNDRGYVVYSALGSFYIPMFVMLFFYWRIYRAAVRTTRAIKKGFKTTKSSPRDPSNSRADDTPLVLRIHRGRPCNAPQRTPLSVHSMSSTLSVNSNMEDGFTSFHNSSSIGQSSTPRRATSMRIQHQRHEKMTIKVSFPSSENVLDLHTPVISSPPSYSSSTITSSRNKSALMNDRQSSFKSSLLEIGENAFKTDGGIENTTESAYGSQRNIETSFSVEGGSSLSAKRRGAKRSTKFQVKRFRMETKAAKTLAIIVGGFIFCWLPFFYYLPNTCILRRVY